MNESKNLTLNNEWWTQARGKLSQDQLFSFCMLAENTPSLCMDKKKVFIANF